MVSGETAGGSVLGMLGFLSQPARHVDPYLGFRWARVLAGAEAALEGKICVVAEWAGAHAGAGGASGTDAVGSRQPGCEGGAGVAARERGTIPVRKKEEVTRICTCVPT